MAKNTGIEYSLTNEKLAVMSIGGLLGLARIVDENMGKYVKSSKVDLKRANTLNTVAYRAATQILRKGKWSATVFSTQG